MNMYPLLVPAGSDTQVQYNNGGLFGGDSALTWDDGAAKALTIGNCAVLGSDSAVFQPNADSTTFFQVKNAAGTGFLFGDSTNSRLKVDGDIELASIDDRIIFPNFELEEWLANRIAFKSTASAIGNIWDFMTGDGDGTDYNYIYMWGVGNEDQATNTEWLKIGFEPSGEDRFVLITEQAGTGVVRPIEISTEGNPQQLWLGTNGYVGIGEGYNPETLTEWTHATPYLTLHNSTHEDSDGGQESRIIFKGEDSGGTERETGRIEVRHDGTGTNGASETALSTMNTSNALIERVKIDSGGIFSINSTDASDSIQIYHDNADAYVTWNDGRLILESAEGDNAVTSVRIYGHGTGAAFYQLLDGGSAAVLTAVADAGHGQIYTQDGAKLRLQHTSGGNVECFDAVVEGETPEFITSGFRTGDALKRSLAIGVGVDAADTASFDGLSNYWFDGTIKSTTGAQLGDGGTTNYTQIEADGTVEFNGAATVWNDANVGAMTLTVPVASQPDEANFLDEAGGDTGITTWAYAIGEKSSGAIEIPHDYKEGSDIYFHIHWQGIVAPTGTDYVKWQCTYTVAQTDATLDAATTITVETAYDTQYEWKLSSCPAITGTNFNIDDQFLFSLERVAAAGDAYAADALIATVGLHYECDTVGSRQMLTKA